MWRLIKWLVFIGIIAVIVLAITGYKIRGKTVQEYLGPMAKSKAVTEAIRDIRSLVGEGLKAAGEAISEDVTDSERKQLEGLLRNELKKGTPIEGAPGQEALPPSVRAIMPTPANNPPANNPPANNPPANNTQRGN